MSSRSIFAWFAAFVIAVLIDSAARVWSFARPDFRPKLTRERMSSPHEIWRL